MFKFPEKKKCNKLIVNVAELFVSNDDLEKIIERELRERLKIEFIRTLF